MHSSSRKKHDLETSHKKTTIWLWGYPKRKYPTLYLEMYLKVLRLRTMTWVLIKRFHRTVCQTADNSSRMYWLIVTDSLQQIMSLTPDSQGFSLRGFYKQSSLFIQNTVKHQEGHTSSFWGGKQIPVPVF